MSSSHSKRAPATGGCKLPVSKSHSFFAPRRQNVVDSRLIPSRDTVSHESIEAGVVDSRRSRSTGNACDQPSQKKGMSGKRSFTSAFRTQGGSKELEALQQLGSMELRDDSDEDDIQYEEEESGEGEETNESDDEEDNATDRDGDVNDVEAELDGEEQNEQHDFGSNQAANTAEQPRKKTRGLNQLKEIHNRPYSNRDSVMVNMHGQPIGDDKICNTFSQFLGTLVQKPRFLPLTYPNWKRVPDKHKELIWEYVNQKYDVPIEGKKWVLLSVRDAWRLYKHRLRKWVYQNFPTYEARVENCPSWIPLEDFKKWLKYVESNKFKTMSSKNSASRKNNIKYVHRTGRVSFARIRAKMRQESGTTDDPSEVEVFKKTIRGKNPVDEETNAFLDIQHCILHTEIEQLETQGDKEVLHERFSEVMGNQQPGRVRSYGRSVTATGLKQISVQQKMEHEMESYKTSLEETLNQKLHNWTEKLTRGLHQTVSLLQSSNPGMVIPNNLFDNLIAQSSSPSDASSALPRTPHDGHGPSSRGTNSPNHRNHDVGNLSPLNGLPR